MSKLNEVNDLAEQVGDFYAWIRDYWTEMGRDRDGGASGMLNFGFWEDDTDTLFDAEENLRKRVAQCLGELPAQAHGLDIGCGIGGAAIRLLQERDVLLTCLDLVPAQLEIGLQSARAAGVADRIEFRRGSAMEMPFDDGIFDFSYCMESSFHYPDKLAFFRENRRVLKTGAVAVVADITCEDNSLVSFRSGNYFLSAEDLRKLMVESGFSVENVIHIGDRVFRPLQAYVARFSAGRRDKLCRYWNLVLKNYARLSARGKMGYEIFILRKAGG